MKEHLRENYFLVLKLFIVLVLEMYIIINYDVLSGVSALVLLFSACFFAAVTGCEIAEEKKKSFFFVLEVILVLFLTFICAKIFFLLFVIFILDFISTWQPEALSQSETYMKSSWFWYLSGYLPLLFTGQEDKLNQLLLVTFLVIIYFQHGVVVRSYQNQLNENEYVEQKLKSNISKKEFYYEEEIKKNLLSAENSILDEKARLSQELHDKLGHSINGSLYQLEACKVLLNQDKEGCMNILQAVIDNLRESMDEIRKILRRERPDKNKLSLMQFQQLCDDCKKTGIDASFIIQGNLSEIPDKMMEILLDNAVEAISNALKYAECTQIEIKIFVLNQLIRCTISDNGVGCEEIIDGMGLSGMRKRIRSVNGILDFEAEAGFTINMLLPLAERNVKI